MLFDNSLPTANSAPLAVVNGQQPVKLEKRGFVDQKLARLFVLSPS
jgi:hypothetical protein